MIQASRRIILIVLLAHSSVFGEYQRNDGSVFSSLRRTDRSAKKTYHFSRVESFDPVNDPIIYADGNDDNTKMIVGFQNMLIFGIFENEKHYVIRVNDELDQDEANVPSEFLNDNDSGELFDIVTLKPTTTTTTTTQFPRFRDRVKDIQRKTLPGFDPDTQSLSEYLRLVSYNMSQISKSIQ